MTVLSIFSDLCMLVQGLCIKSYVIQFSPIREWMSNEAVRDDFCVSIDISCMFSEFTSKVFLILNSEFFCFSIVSSRFSSSLCFCRSSISLHRRVSSLQINLWCKYILFIGKRRSYHYIFPITSYPHIRLTGNVIRISENNTECSYYSFFRNLITGNIYK